MMQERMMSRPRVQHVSIPRPPGSADQARSFYSTLLGLEEVPPPPSIRHLDLVWYRLGTTELHLFAEEPTFDSSGRHFCMEVDDLESLRTRLIAGGYTPEESLVIPGRPRFFCRDPFGNSIEFTTILSDYLQAGVESSAS
jgi:catechol 2,3-dioxygenase-like lactoylglutathione lyase family enzyme